MILLKRLFQVVHASDKDEESGRDALFIRPDKSVFATDGKLLVEAHTRQQPTQENLFADEDLVKLANFELTEPIGIRRAVIFNGTKRLLSPEKVSDDSLPETVVLGPDSISVEGASFNVKIDSIDKIDKAPDFSYEKILRHALGDRQVKTVTVSINPILLYKLARILLKLGCGKVQMSLHGANIPLEFNGVDMDGLTEVKALLMPMRDSDEDGKEPAKPNG